MLVGLGKPFEFKRAVIGLLIACASLLATAVANAEQIGTAERVVNDVTTRSFGERVATGDGLVADETIVTKDRSVIDIRLVDQSTLLIGENAELLLDEMVYARKDNMVTGAFSMLSGVIRVSTAGVPMNFEIETPVATIGIRGTIFDLMVRDQLTEIAVLEGLLRVNSPFGQADVGPGQIYRVTAQEALYRSLRSREFQTSMQRMLTLFERAQAAPAPTRQAAQKQATQQQAALPAPSAELPDELKGQNLENYLVLSLPRGLVFIELLPNVAPRHAARLKQLARRGFYDGLAWHYVRQDYVAETGDPAFKPGGAGGGGSGQTLKAEISRTPFTEGTFGMSHPPGNADGGDSRFFVALGPSARQLDGKYTAWGRVVLGMEHLKALKNAERPKTVERVQTLRVAADVYR